ncbi:hypothetical protein V5F53_05850 [Xanthobacter sp. V4C-4]|uniref:hypothetical protein n=1 Tax=Xanthobacter cornucopiae TaxID=3119924 RepID=UPI0037275BAA
MFEGLAAERRCKAALRRHANEGIYQVKATYVGDLVFQRKQAAGIDTTVAAKLGQVEPSIKSTFGQTLNLGFSGQGLVFSFVPILRSGSGI